MPATIKCPNCGHQFPMEDSVSEEYKKELREQMIAFTKKKEEEYQRKQDEFSRQVQVQQEEFQVKLATEKRLMQQSLEESLRKTISADFDNQLRMLEQSNKDNEEKLKLSRQKELEFLLKEKELTTREEELELSVQRKLQLERAKLTEDIRKLEEQKTASRETEYQLKLKELEKQLDTQKKLAAEMQRKAEQGSMQLQGEVQELELENLLRAKFPFDSIEPVPKGEFGGDASTAPVAHPAAASCGNSNAPKTGVTAGWPNYETTSAAPRPKCACWSARRYPKGWTRLIYWTECGSHPQARRCQWPPSCVRVCCKSARAVPCLKASTPRPR